MSIFHGIKASLSKREFLKLSDVGDTIVVNATGHPTQTFRTWTSRTMWTQYSIVSEEILDHPTIAAWLDVEISGGDFEGTGFPVRALLELLSGPGIPLSNPGFSTHTDEPETVGIFPAHKGAIRRLPCAPQKTGIDQ